MSMPPSPPALRPFPLILGDLKPTLTLSQLVSSDSPQRLHPILSPCVGDSCSSHCPPELQPLRLHLPWSHSHLVESGGHSGSVCLFATPWTIARQTPLSMESSRQEYWSYLESIIKWYRARFLPFPHYFLLRSFLKNRTLVLSRSF